MRSHLLATAIIASLGLASADAFAAKASTPAVTPAQLEQLQAQIAALQAQVQQLQAQSESLQAQSDAQSEVNVVQAKAVEDAQATTTKVDKLAKLVNDTKVGGRVFYNFSSVSREVNGNKSDSSSSNSSNLAGANGVGFDVKRFYLTVDHQFNEIWSANVTTDARYVGTVATDTGASTATTTNGAELFIKKAYVKAAFSKAFAVSVGAADMPWIPFAEKAQGPFRYIASPAVDNFGIGTSADWGAHATGDFSSGVGYAVSVVNGKGYRDTSRSQGVDVEARLSYAPTSSLLFAVGGYNGKHGLDMENNTNELSTAKRYDVLAAYISPKFRFGGEWFRTESWAVTNEREQEGYSVWGSAQLTEGGITAIARYDYIDRSKNKGITSFLNNEDTYWHAGLEFPIVKGVKLAAVYKRYDADSGSSGATNTKTDEFGVYGDVQF